MSDSYVLTTIANKILRISFNRPEKRNALTQEMYATAAAAIHAAEQQPEVRIILLTGEGGHFTSGNDLKDFAVPSDGESPVIRFQTALMCTSKPVVTAVSGMAIGIGATLLLHTDINLVAHNARLQFPFVKLALVPEFACSYLLPLLAGRARASQLLLTGEPFSGEIAFQLGLASQVCEAEQVDVQATQIAHKLANLPPAALRHTKALMKSHVDQAKLDKIYREELAIFAQSLISAEHREAVGAFFQKRDPDFSPFN